MNWTAVRARRALPRDLKVTVVCAFMYALAGCSDADLAGSLKYQTRDLRDVLERASARGTAARVHQLFAQAGLPASVKDLPDLGAGPDDFVQMMLQDKKAKDGKLTLILARGIGQSFIEHNVDEAVVRSYLADALKQ